MAVGAVLPTSARVRRALRKGLAQMIAVQGDRTADILRYSVTGTPDPIVGTRGTVALVAGLSGLPVLTDLFAANVLRGRSREEMQLGEGERLFFFIDIPATSGVSAGTLLGTDFILSGGKKWRPIENTIANDPTTGHSWCRAVVADRG